MKIEFTVKEFGGVLLFALSIGLGAGVVLL